MFQNTLELRRWAAGWRTVGEGSSISPFTCERKRNALGLQYTCAQFQLVYMTFYRNCLFNKLVSMSLSEMVRLKYYSLEHILFMHFLSEKFSAPQIGWVREKPLKEK